MNGTDKNNPCTDTLNYAWTFDVSNHVIRWPVIDNYDWGTTNISSSEDAIDNTVDTSNGSNDTETFKIHF